MHHHRVCAFLFLIFYILGSLTTINSAPVAALPNPVSESANIATMPLASNVADGMNSIDNVSTNPGLNGVTSSPVDSSMSITSGE